MKPSVVAAFLLVATLLGGCASLTTPAGCNDEVQRTSCTHVVIGLVGIDANGTALPGAGQVFNFSMADGPVDLPPVVRDSLVGHHDGDVVTVPMAVAWELRLTNPVALERTVPVAILPANATVGELLHDRSGNAYVLASFGSQAGANGTATPVATLRFQPPLPDGNRTVFPAAGVIRIAHLNATAFWYEYLPLTGVPFTPASGIAGRVLGANETRIFFTETQPAFTGNDLFVQGTFRILRVDAAVEPFPFDGNYAAPTNATTG
ncbi:MAG: hypothetical protein ACYDBQ_06115 [Thermoplasmatota archaeon]